MLINSLENTIVDVNGFKMEVYGYNEYISEQLRLFGAYEKEYIKLLTTKISPGDLVIDIGANIGLHTLHYSRAVGPTARL